MSTAVFNQIAEAMGEVNTALQQVFGRDDKRLFLLKRSDFSAGFDVVEELTSGWRVKSGETRDDLFLFYATDEDFADTASQYTHIGYGVPKAGKVFLYKIEPGQKEKTLPDVLSPEWKAFAVRVENERYTIA